MPRRKEPRIPDAILDQLLAGADPKTALDPNGLLDELKKALAERALNAEMDHHLAGDRGAGNSRNGYGRKSGHHRYRPDRARGAAGSAGEFDPQLIAKYSAASPASTTRSSRCTRGA
jgi:putative transposase